MTTGRLRSTAAIGAVTTALLAAPIASAQYAADPLFDTTVAQSQAIGFEQILNAFRIFEAVPRSDYEEIDEQVEMMTGAHLERFIGTLRERDPDLADALQQQLEGVADTVEDGNNPDILLPVARQLLAEAYDTVVPPEIHNQPAFIGGLIAQLLLGEGGVSEGLEEAFDEPWEWANGWSSLQRVKELWAEVSGAASPELAANIEQMITSLDAIFTQAEPPEDFAGMIAEEAEPFAQGMVGYLESVLDAQLYTGRDPIRLIAHLTDLAGPACQSYEAGKDEIGRETIYAIFDNFGDTTGLGDMIGLFDPEVGEMMETAFGGLIPLAVAEDADDDDNEDGGGGASSSASGSGSGDGSDVMTGAPACNALIEALEEARSVLGG